MSQETLHREIVDRSQSSDWDEAKGEWSLQDVWMSEEPLTCLCGHHPIKEICEIRNRLTGSEVDVGNCCVNNFLGLESEGLFASIRRVVADDANSFNAQAIGFAYKRGIINKWEYDFYLDIWRKRVLSPKQANIKDRINKKMLRHLVR